MKRSSRRTDTFITADHVASLTGFCNAGAFRRARALLERDFGFPSPMPGHVQPMKWRRAAVEAWAATADQPGGSPPAGPNVVLMAEARR